MRSLIGLFWILGGGLGGCIVAVIAAFVIGSVASPSHRDGALGYLVFLLGFVGVLIGMAVGLGAYGRSAPAGEIGAYLKAGAIGFAALVALGSLCLGAFLHLREDELRYNGSALYMMMELRVANSSLPRPNPEPMWFRVEIETSYPTFPSADVYWSEVSTEANHTIYPALFSPLYRSGHRKVFVHVGRTQVETFTPPVKRVPDLMSDWSPWIRPSVVNPPYGVEASAPLNPMFELRYRVRKYNENFEESGGIDWKRYF